MSNKIGNGYGHSKIILIGEHSVVYGYPAIALPLKNINILCHIKKSDKSLRFDLSDPVSTALYTSLESLNQKDACVEYSICSEIPQRRGMGSSAAVAIAVIRAVYDYFGKTISDFELEKLVNQSEIAAHGNPSGLDAKTCLSDVPIKYIRNIGFKSLEFSLDAYLIIADSGIYGKTSQAVDLVAQNELINRPYLKELGQLTEKVESAIKTHSLEELGHLFDKAHKNLEKIGVSIPEINVLVEESRKSGALGAKMSGGGLGGCIIALAKTYEEAKTIASHLEEKGALKTWIEKV